MSKENNKMQVDIDTLKKQNVNDLLSIKELYSKLKELDERILQIKYIDNTIVKKLKKEYEKLEKTILDKNIPNSLIDLEKNLIDIDYLNNPLSFISWYNSASTTIIEDNTNKINGFKSLNIQSNSTDTHWNMLKEIPYNKQGKLTFSYLRKASILNGQNVNAIDSNDKWYGGDPTVVENYYKGWDLV